MKRVVGILLVAVLITTAAVTSLVVGYMFRVVDMPNTLLPGKVSCTVEEVVSQDDDSTTLTKQEVTVKNTGDTQAYIRVKVLTYWQDSKGNIVGSKIDNDLLGVNKYDNSNWIRSEKTVVGNVSSITYYCKTPIDPGENTPDLLATSAMIVLDVTTTKVDGVTYTYRQVAEIIPEAIQSQPADAGTSSWHVTLDSNGNITSAS